MVKDVLIFLIIPYFRFEGLSLSLSFIFGFIEPSAKDSHLKPKVIMAMIIGTSFDEDAYLSVYINLKDI